MNARSLSRRVARAIRGPSGEPAAPAGEPAAPAGEPGYDGWLQQYYDDVLAPIDAACAAGERDLVALCSGLDVELWALLLTQEYSRYPNLRALLPDVPDPALQAGWNGLSGVPLATQSAAFYRTLCARYAQAGERPLADSRVLDFGCGWGRLTRFLARDVPPDRLHGCDPVESILDVCRASRVPATLARSEFLPERLPFDEPFDLAFAFSVFTHLSEPAHERCLAALHNGLKPGAILVATIRPPDYLATSPLMELVRDAPLTRAAYVFAPHAADPHHPQYAGPEMSYGETVLTLPYVRERWSRWFDLVRVDLLLGDLYQVALTLRRRG